MEYTIFNQMLTDIPIRAIKRNRNRHNTTHMSIDTLPPYNYNTKLYMSKVTDKFIYKYSCAMLNLSDDISTNIIEWSKNNIPEDALFIDVDSGIYGYEDTPHVTVKYGLHDCDPTRLAMLIDGYGPIKLKLGLIEKFDQNPNFDVLKIAIQGQGIYNLNKHITDNMRHTEPFNEYNPHITLAYIKKNTCDKLLSNATFDKLEDEVYEIYFTSKTGDEYFLPL